VVVERTEIVPIGEDKRQHVELARDVAERFNARFGETLTVPKAVFPEVGAKIMDLQEPEKKMSTTGGTAQGTVLVLDPPDTIRKKFRSAVTDSGREVVRSPEKPGISNLVEIMSVARGENPEAVEAQYDGQGYGAFKTDVGEAVVELFDPIRRAYEELRADETELQRLLARGAEKARKASEPVLQEMYDRMGFVKSTSGRFFGAARPRAL
jgi:tryptophanyl-tRNA synthetase